jgi:spore maturation protein CgeB
MGTVSTTQAPSASPILEHKLAYKKFKGRGPFKVLVLNSGYHLQRECARALENLGHQVLLSPVTPGNFPLTLQNLLLRLSSFKPDCLLVINHIGFDDGHQLGTLLERCRVPIACWYCDSPFFVLRGGTLPAPTMTSIFVWERTLIPTLKQLGTQDVSYLPLGCDPQAFAEADGVAIGPYPVSFVGDSMRHAISMWHQRLKPQEVVLATRFSDALATQARMPLAPLALATSVRSPTLNVWDALGAATFLATSQYRDRVLAAVPSHDLHIFGDIGWQKAAPVGSTVHGQVSYGPHLAAIYKNTAVSINATSLQMPTAVNQRVFDVPLAGGFVLSDAQEDQSTLFEPHVEAITYQHPGELKELIAFYGPRPSVRQRITQKAREAITARHTYAHRMQALMAHMQMRHQ